MLIYFSEIWKNNRRLFASGVTLTSLLLGERLACGRSAHALHSATLLVIESELCFFLAGSSRRSSGRLSGDAGSVNIRSGGLEGPCDDHYSLQSRTASQQPASSGHSTTMQRLVIQRRFVPCSVQMNVSWPPLTYVSFPGRSRDLDFTAPTILGDIYMTKYLINE